MSTTKRLSVKAAKPQDQTSASKAQALIDHILDEKTTELSKAIEDSVVDSLVYGSSAMRLDASGTLSVGNTSTTIRINPSLYTTVKQPVTVPLSLNVLENDPMFQLTREQLRAAWLVQYGRKWIRDSDIQDRDMLIAAHRLTAMGEMESHYIDYEPHRRIVE